MMTQAPYRLLLEAIMDGVTDVDALAQASNLDVGAVAWYLRGLDANGIAYRMRNAKRSYRALGFDADVWMTRRVGVGLPVGYTNPHPVM